METEAAAVPAAAPAEPGAPVNRGTTGTWATVKQFITRLLVIYFVSSLLRGWRQQPKDESAAGVGRSSSNIFSPGSMMDVYAYLSESEEGVDFDNDPLFWRLRQVPYGDWTSGPHGDGSWVHSGQVDCPPGVQRNGSLYLHVFITRTGRSPDPSNSTYSKTWTMRRSHRLNRYRRKSYQKTKNLLTGETEASPEHLLKADTIKSEVISYWHPNLTVNVVFDQTAWTRGQLPGPLATAVLFHPIDDYYYPIVFFNDYWNLLADYQPINDTVKKLNLSITFAPLSLFKWQLYASQSKSWFDYFGSEHFEESDEEKDSLKQTLLETSPYLLALTVVVSLLHTVFEFLAFKNDIMFWRNRDNLEGLSVRSVLFNVSTSLIVFLYVLDNDTNFMIRLSVFFGMMIDLWKIPKCLDISVNRQRLICGVPTLTIREKTSYVESSTKEYDMMAFKYLSWVLFPLLAGYAVYSLVYLEHRAWYSWVLSMLYGFLLTFGFIMMTPQLFINYKLKSVAHLPWRMLTYKFLNTFIDDLFAFVIKTPMLYRIGCFRDDIIFIIYLYQRWAYRVDPNRTHEFEIPTEKRVVQPGSEEGVAAAAEADTDGKKKQE